MLESNTKVVTNKYHK